MAFVFAFLIGGAICALGQLVVEAKVPVPVALVTFIIIGAILTPLGIMDKLLALGPGGVCIFAIGFGNAAFNTGAALMKGSAAPIIMVASLLIFLIAIGSLCGLIVYKRKPGEKVA